MATSVTAGTGIALQIYRNHATPNNLIDFTATGEGDASDSIFTLRQGETLVAVYSGGAGSANATATLTVSGTVGSR
jgi:type 1 fimbria pilin